jgi:hypothetical protein
MKECVPKAYRINTMSASSKSSIGYYPEAEVVFGITCPLGVSYRPVLDSLRLYLEQFGYSYNEVKLHQHLVLFNHVGLGLKAEFLEHIPHLRTHFVHPAQVKGGVYQTPQEPGASTDLKVNA